MTRSAGTRFLILGLLTLLMFIPLFFVGAVIDSRAEYSRETVASVGRDWGGPQTLNGPVLVVPVQGPVTRTIRREVTDPATGEIRTEAVDQTGIGLRAPLFVYPTTFDAIFRTETEVRSRGIFDVPVYVTMADLTFDFDSPDDASLLTSGEEPQWDQARLVLGLTDNRALRGAATLTVGGAEVPLSPRAEAAGIEAPVTEAALDEPFRLALTFNGAERLSVVPVGRNTSVTMTSDWPDPSFDGAFLPDGSEVTEEGFTARWTIPHLARNLPQVSREDFEGTAAYSAFGVSLFQPNDFYQKAYRAARYGILFIALTFLTVFLIEDRTRRPVHPVQYILIGVAQSLFVLLMVAYAEQVGFGPAYALSAGATIVLLMVFAWTGMKLGRRSLVLGAMLLALYAVLYLILRSADYALLAGSTLAFLALTGTIVATRNEDWYGPERPERQRRGLFGRASVPPVPGEALPAE